MHGIDEYHRGRELVEEVEGEKNLCPTSIFCEHSFSEGSVLNHAGLYAVIEAKTWIPLEHITITEKFRCNLTIV